MLHLLHIYIRILYFCFPYTFQLGLLKLSCQTTSVRRPLIRHDLRHAVECLESNWLLECLSICLNTHVFLHLNIKQNSTEYLSDFTNPLSQLLSFCLFDSGQSL